MTQIDLDKLQPTYIWNLFWSNLLHSFNGVSVNTQHSLFVSIPLLVLAVLFIPTLLILRVILRNKKAVKEPSILLEITPPAITEKSAYTTQELFKTIHGLEFKRSFLDKLVGKKPTISCEIVSTQNQGIRYLIRVTPDQLNTLKRNLYSYLPFAS